MRPEPRPQARGVRGGPAQARPLLPAEARGSLAGLSLFALGFALAGVLVAAGSGSTPPYYVAVSLGLIGIGVLGFFSRRVPAEVQPPPVWSPRGLTRIADGAGLPAPAVVVTFYVLVVVSVVGNLLVPLVVRR